MNTQAGKAGDQKGLWDTCARTGGPLLSRGLSLAHLGLGLVGGAQSLFPLLLSVALTLHLLP